MSLGRRNSRSLGQQFQRRIFTLNVVSIICKNAFQMTFCRIEDADFARETIILTQFQILEKSSQQSLANFVSDRTKQLKTISLSTETLSDKLT